MNLNDVLNDEASKASIIEDVVRLIDGEVANQKGLSGIAVKTGYKLVQGVKPGFVRNVVQALLPEFAAVLEPIREQALAEGQTVSGYFAAHSQEIAEALLVVTDGRAQKSDHGSVKGAYTKLRGSARKNVESAVPGLGAIIEKYAA
jgi:fructosamine-3-kinase